MGKDMKAKHSVPSIPAPKVWGDVFLKEALQGGTNFFGKFMKGCFIWGLMIM